MATPLTASQILAALIAEGLDVKEHPGWRTHDRGNRGDGWGPVNGVMIHHTGGTAPSDGEIVWSGRADLPGPCAHAYLAKDGTLTLTSAGRANHAGGGDGAVLQAVIAESYTTRPPAPHKHDGSPGAVDGNARFYGLEVSDRGTGSAWPAAQYEAAVRWAAAICRAHGWTAKSVIGHKEWSDWKPDPAAFDMAAFRQDVQARLDASTKPKPPAAPVPSPAKPSVSLSKLIKAAKTDPPKSGTPVSYAGVKTVEAALAAEGLLAKSYVDGHYGTATKDAMSGWQERCGYRGRKPGQAADGIPGKDSLTRLGKKHGFTVIA
ncbi:N-acetylmuramoyl-L-alanine amidase [Streptomyces sp. NPDC042207]|uniref:peptidoglycan recognition protein family protein n=1 Tax=Streptomyces sp. NPDC042207 TaxID=3154331 RepID=UPI0033C04C2B